MTRGHALTLSAAVLLVLAGVAMLVLTELGRPPASASAMERCSRLAAEGVREPGCLRAWREARRRFLEPAAAR